MGGYQRYEAYQDSGIKWLGQIPAHWEAKRFKFLISGSFQYGANEAAEIDDPELPRYIRITDVREDGSLRDDTFRSLPEHIAQDYLLEEGDILLARSGATVGKTFIYSTAWGRAAYAGYLIRARVSDNEYSRFVYQFLQSNSYWEWVKSSFIQATIQNISAEKYANLWIPVPPLEEQKSIARFLDYKTAQIDALIAKKASLLKKLAEKRSALISQAVTKGLAIVPMKDSGVEWLGEIPAHWQVFQIKRAFTLQRGVDITKDQQTEGNIPVVSSGGIASYHNISYAKAPGVVVGRKGTLGKVYYLEQDYWPHDTTLWVMEFYKNYPKFVYYKLLSMELETWDTGSANPTLNRNLIHPLKTAWPPVEEQIQIVEFLQTAIIAMDQQCLKVRLAIDRLKEYRTALITNAVTGAIDVRNVAIPDDSIQKHETV